MAGGIAIGSDHAGFALKEALKAYLEAHEVPVEDCGCNTPTRCDYPDIAERVAQRVSRGDCVQGILCCGSGVGVSIAANRFVGVRAVVCHDTYIATMSRRHNDANVICFGGRIVAAEYAQEILEIFMNTPFEGGRHQGRVDKMDTLVIQGSPSC